MCEQVAQTYAIKNKPINFSFDTGQPRTQDLNLFIVKHVHFLFGKQKLSNMLIKKIMQETFAENLNLMVSLP